MKKSAATATELQITVVARVAGEDFDLHATKYGATGNYQVQNNGVKDNAAFFARVTALGAAVSFMTLNNGEWTQKVGPRSVDLGDDTKDYHTTFALKTAPSAPPALPKKK